MRGVSKLRAENPCEGTFFHVERSNIGQIAVFFFFFFSKLEPARVALEISGHPFRPRQSKGGLFMPISTAGGPRRGTQKGQFRGNLAKRPVSESRERREPSPTLQAPRLELQDYGPRLDLEATLSQRVRPLTLTLTASHPRRPTLTCNRGPIRAHDDRKET